MYTHIFIHEYVCVFVFILDSGYTEVYEEDL